MKVLFGKIIELNMHQKQFLIIFLIFLVILLSGCSESVNTVISTPYPSPTPSAASELKVIVTSSE